jgi:hypothetical protein
MIDASRSAKIEQRRFFSAEQSWKMSEPEKVVALIVEVRCWRLGNWDGCCCSRFSVRNVDVDISCGKGREQAVWICSSSMDYDDKSLLKPIMKEVIKQLKESSGRGGSFKQYFDKWKYGAA